VLEVAIELSVWIQMWKVLHNIVVGSQRPTVRSDGWLEIEIGEFFNLGQDVEVQMNVKETNNWKRRLFLEGIEVTPK